MRRGAFPTLLLALLPIAVAGCAQPAQEEPEASGSQAAVYEPLGNGDFELRARIMPEEWRGLP
jgi:hypothetical protein